MRIGTLRVVCVAACLFALAGCSGAPSGFKLGSLMPGGAEDAPPPAAASPGSEVTGSIATPASGEPNFAVKDALLGGEPLDGHRHLWWNFVSSSKERIEQAKQDWLDGRFGRIEGDDEFIPLPQR